MKFGKKLNDMIEESQSEFADKFLAYKQLKKKLKSLPIVGEDQISEIPSSTQATSDRCQCMTPEEKEFVKMLNEELEKFNDFYMEKEEEYVIELQNLEDELDKVDVSQVELSRLRLRFVKFHGQLVLLQNWSALNYSALVKILKKHDKHSSITLRSSFLCNVLAQPFYSVEVLRDMITRAEQGYQTIAGKQFRASEAIDGHSMGIATTSEPVLIALSINLDDMRCDISDIDPSIMRQTEIALNMWNNVKSLSIPVPDQNGVWKREKDDSSDDEESAMPKKQKIDST
mmetsp:Transcript_33406/g.56086  ORF Transcript_33406/g.56086 Transcript_33406/m.56086 type:complete len:286 (-) Transcript_33406:433-1290(-)|eukprot:CAMPEP_0198213050 /NCGR_PEP_ID=MMETSP1445-20131203/28647_1 /TAXON_ID=36898 /ORGANISM="Pyramimonas sp., Strain CCMP2087" /LENGTH=285 /DNA_ID=CAMNT_0043887641 /DNA_START=302 /DNA_END=1159 /DNA_ORIENTATION=+